MRHPRSRSYGSAVTVGARTWACWVPLLYALLGGGCAVEPAFDYPLDGELRLNHIQMKGSHNSYHVKTPNIDFPDWSYTQSPIAYQLAEEGVRQLDLDVYFDLDVPGAFQVLHAPLADAGSNCPLLTDCLQEIKRWSDANPAHHPLVIFVEPKDQLNNPDFAEEVFQSLEATITAVLPMERFITPDQVQGDLPSLPQAIRSRGWPLLGEVRGKILLVLFADGKIRIMYTHGDRSLRGRLMFVTSWPDRPDAAVLAFDDPRNDADAIQKAVRDGFLVRVQSDYNSVEPLKGDYSRLRSALDSGAHFVTTDYPAPVDGVPYFVEIPGGTPSRCNPQTAPAPCTPTDLENPAFMRDPR